MADFLTLTNIYKTFNPDTEIAVHALHDVNLSIDSGEFVVLAGPSGSGKTTLLNLIGTLDTPTKGEIILDGRKLTGLNESALVIERREHIGFVFQAYNLVSVLTAKENIEYILKLQGKSQAFCDARVDEIAEILGIKELLHKLPSHLSGGQQQRVAVARAVASKPKLILADEPTANLDSVSAKALMDMMVTLNESEKITIIFSSHDPLVINMAKRLVMLRDGKVEKNALMG